MSTPADGQLPSTLQHLEEGMAAGLHIGAQLYVEQNGTVRADLAIGEAQDGVPLRPDTLMLWLSSGKPVAAVAIGQLLERGDLDLDDRITKYIPHFGSRGKQDITLRHLLTHTSGFRGADIDWPDAEWADIIDRIAYSKMEPNWVAGEKAGYHVATSWFILGELVRCVDGRPYEEFVRHEIFLPLGMHHCFVGIPQADLDYLGDQVAVMQRTSGDSPEPHAYHASEAGYITPHPGANAHGPIRELGRFYRMLLNQGEFEDARILEPETVELLTRRHRIGMFDETFKRTMDWGLGFIVNSSHYGEAHLPYGYGAHASPDAFGHSGAESSCGFADPAHDLVVCWVCNGAPGEARHQRRQHAINTAIYEDLGLG